MNTLSRLLAVILIVPIISCTTAPAVNIKVQGVQMPIVPRPAQAFPNQPEQQPRMQISQMSSNTSSPYWTGDGGRGSITILPPKGVDLAENQMYLPDLVANELVSNFRNFSAMTLFDRVNNQRQYDELLSGIYSDDDQAGWDLGHLTSTDFMLLGNITRTSTGYVLQLTVNRNRDKTTVASYSGAVSIVELDNLVGVRRASLDLLQKMGVQLTAQARTELTRAATADHVNALTAMAQGISAQRQGTEVAALTYFFQAAAFDASLTEAVSRTNVLSTNISTGNIGANVRNDIAWRSGWVEKLTETETFLNNMLMDTSPQRSIWYTTNIQEQERSRDYTRETTELNIEAALHTHAVFPISVQRTVQAVYDGLQTTERAQAWGLNYWPQRGVTNTNPFNRGWGGMIAVAFEVINEQGNVIGRQTVEMDSRYSYNGTSLSGPGTAFTTVRFTGVSAHAISDRLNIRIASINGLPPEEAGISRIEPISAQQMQSQKNFTVYNGVIQPSSRDRDLGALTIPAILWSEQITAIGNGAFERRGISSLTISPGITTIGANAFANNRLSSVSIPQGVISIGERAFADNYWRTATQEYNPNAFWIGGAWHLGLTRVTIANSVTTIGKEAFAKHWVISFVDKDGRRQTHNHWMVTEVTIGANVSLGENAIGNGFEAFYAKEGRQPGTYRVKKRTSSFDGNYTASGRWERFSSAGEMEDKVDSRNKARKAALITLGVITAIGLLAGVIYVAIDVESKAKE